MKKGIQKKQTKQNKQAQLDLVEDALNLLEQAKRKLNQAANMSSGALQGTYQHYEKQISDLIVCDHGQSGLEPFYIDEINSL